MIGSPIDHLTSLNESPVPLIKLEELSSLLSTANIYFAVYRRLKNGGEVTEWMLNLLELNCLACEIL